MRHYRITLFLLCGWLVFSQCNKEKFTTDPSAVLSFSTDTVFFDTLFTAIGSTTQILKIYNTHSESIHISQIRLEGGSDSPYRMNVNGVDTDMIEGVDILPEDSLFLFVEVTLDPNDETFPFIVEDQITFLTNGTEQRVALLAWGRDAYFHGEPDGFFVLPPGEVWQNDKPHVVYGIVAVDENQVLTIEPGTEIYVHQGGGLYIYKSKIVATGTSDQRIVFQGDRLEPEYQDVPGQWGTEVDVQFQSGIGPDVVSISRGGIWLVESTGSILDWVELKNGNIGIQVDSSGTPGYALDMKHTSITNMSVIGLWGQGASIKGENCLLANCGQSCAALTIGGKYAFTHSTFGNYWTYGTRSAPAFLLSNYYEDLDQNIQIRALDEADFRNCIFYGNNAQLTDFSEWVVDLKDPDLQSYEFHNCIVDTDEPVNDDGLHWFSMRLQVPNFSDPANGNFRPLSSLSYMNTSNSEGVTDDLDAQSRTFPEYTLGCFEKD